MPTLCEYTTVSKLKIIKDSQLTASDALLLDMIRQTSREIEDIANRWFFPRMMTQYFDTPKGNDPLIFSHDLLEVVTLTNGDGTVITNTDYKLYPLNSYPKYELRLLPIKYTWQYDTHGTPYGAITAATICGYHDDYTSAWVDSLATLSAAITTTTQTTVTVPTGLITAGDLLKIDAEFIYVSGVIVGATDTLTMIRGVNGSTAATHLISAPVLRWDPGTDLEMLCRRGALAYTKLRSNPVSETVNVDGITFITPKDVGKWFNSQLRGLGLCRIGIG